MSDFAVEYHKKHSDDLNAYLFEEIALHRRLLFFLEKGKTLNESKEFLEGAKWAFEQVLEHKAMYFDKRCYHDDYDRAMHAKVKKKYLALLSPFELRFITNKK